MRALAKKDKTLPKFTILGLILQIIYKYDEVLKLICFLYHAFTRTAGTPYL